MTIAEIGKVLAPALREGGAKKAIRFGSYARGDADEHSDLDLLVVADTETAFFERHKAFSAIYELWRGGWTF